MSEKEPQQPEETTELAAIPLLTQFVTNVLTDSDNPQQIAEEISKGENLIGLANGGPENERTRAQQVLLIFIVRVLEFIVARNFEDAANAINNLENTGCPANIISILRRKIPSVILTQTVAAQAPNNDDDGFEIDFQDGPPEELELDISFYDPAQPSKIRRWALASALTAVGMVIGATYFYSQERPLEVVNIATEKENLDPPPIPLADTPSSPEKITYQKQPLRLNTQGRVDWEKMFPNHNPSKRIIATVRGHEVIKIILKERNLAVTTESLLAATRSAETSSTTPDVNTFEF